MESIIVPSMSKSIAGYVRVTVGPENLGLFLCSGGGSGVSGVMLLANVVSVRTAMAGKCRN